MGNLFCRKSVFSILFLVSFLAGTICGVFLFRIIFSTHSGWIEAYCRTLSVAPRRGGLNHLLFLAWPFLAVVGAALLPGYQRTIPVLIALRGCVLTYTSSAFYMSGTISYGFLLRNAFLLILFYFL